MTNAELFKQTFGRYATDVWSLPEDEFLEWLNADVQQKTGRWIPISERLPEDEQDVLISLTWDNGVCEVRQGDRDSIDYWKHFNHIIFIAWMPLPDPYVTDTNDGKMKEGDKH